MRYHLPEWWRMVAKYGKWIFDNMGNMISEYELRRENESK